MSEKPSDTSTPPDVPVLLLDENLSSADIAGFLRRFPKVWQIELHTEHFRRGMPDVEVINECASRGWVLISCDDRIRYDPQNKAAVLSSKLKAFMFNRGNYQGVEYGAALIVGRSQIVNAIRKHAGPMIARIQVSGDVVVLEPQPSATLSARDKTRRKYGDKLGRNEIEQ